jgi:hypothetical protein
MANPVNRNTVLGTEPDRKQTQLTLPRSPGSLLDPISDSWTIVDVEKPYVPELGSKLDDERVFQVKPATEIYRGNVAASDGGCGQGKSTMVRKHLKTVLTINPHRRTLVLTINRIYATSTLVEYQTLEKDLRESGVTSVHVASYMTKGVNLSAHSIVLCSFESLHKVAGQRFDTVILDECSSLARLIGGGTMNDFNNAYTLRELCEQMGTCVIALDADLRFKMSESEPATVSEDFFSVVVPNRPVLCASLRKECKPDHLRRTVQIYFKCGSEKKADKHGVELVNPSQHWWLELKAKADAYHRDPSVGFIFISVGTKQFGREVCTWLRKSFKLNVKFYHGDSSEKERFGDLSNPSRAWIGVGAVVCTTAVGPGVDLKGPQDGGVACSAVFAYFDRMGCNFQQLCQALVRPRHVGDQEMRILIDCMPPELRSKLVEAKEVRPIVHPTYEDENKELQRRRGAAVRYSAKEQQAAGGLPRGVKPYQSVTDGTLRVMAHSRLERKMQMCDPFFAATQLFMHHDWTVANPRDEQASDPMDLDALDIPAISDDEMFDQEWSPEQKHHWACCQIVSRGEAGFFHEKCWGLAADERKGSNELTAGDQWLIKIYFGLRHLGYLPGLDELEADLEAQNEDGADQEAPIEDEADELEADQEAPIEDEADQEAKWPRCVQILSALLGNCTDAQSKVPMLNLNAHCRCIEKPEDMAKLDFHARMSPYDKTKDHQLYLTTGRKLCSIERLGRILLGGGYRQLRQLVEQNVTLSKRFVDTANRFKTNESDERDNHLVAQLNEIAKEMEVSIGRGSLEDILGALAKAMGMDLCIKRGQQQRLHGKRVRLIESMTMTPILPDLVNDWMVKSPLLHRPVRVCDWQQEHEAARTEGIETHYHDDMDYDDAFVKPYEGGDTTNERTELIHAGKLQREITRLRGKRNRSRASFTESEANQLRMLEAFDEKAEPEKDGVRRNHVVYGKSRQLGRRTASYPSAQSCPSKLRKKLFGRWYHDVDIVNCHPTLMDQLLAIMGKADKAPKVNEYVNNREPMLRRIAEHYGCKREPAKDLVLRVLNGGTLRRWLTDNGLNERSEDQDDIRDLIEEARVVRETFFEWADREKPGTVEGLKGIAKAHLMKKKQAQKAEVAKAIADGRPPPEHKPVSLSQAAIARSAFSHIMFELEDQILDVIDNSLRDQGWTVASLIYDGMHVKHRDGDVQDQSTGHWQQLDSALRKAEEDVQTKKGYRIELLEKPLYAGPGDTEANARKRARRTEPGSSSDV